MLFATSCRQRAPLQSRTVCPESSSQLLAGAPSGPGGWLRRRPSVSMRTRPAGAAPRPASHDASRKRPSNGRGDAKCKADFEGEDKVGRVVAVGPRPSGKRAVDHGAVDRRRRGARAELLAGAGERSFHEAARDFHLLGRFLDAEAARGEGQRLPGGARVRRSGAAAACPERQPKKPWQSPATSLADFHSSFAENR